jgi:hypothetical protein
MPKDMGGWGIKNLNWFCKSLGAKSLWRLIHNSMLWGRVLKSKYFGNKSIKEWFRLPNKLGNKSLVGWKAMVEVVPIIGNWTVWQVGNGKNV